MNFTIDSRELQAVFNAPQVQAVINDVVASLLQLVIGIVDTTQMIVENTFNSCMSTLLSLNDVHKSLLLTLRKNPMMSEPNHRMDERLRVALTDLKATYTSSTTGISGLVNQMSGRAGLLKTIVEGIQNTMTGSITDLKLFADKCLSSNQVVSMCNDLLVCAQSAQTILDGEHSRTQETVTDVFRRFDNLSRRRSNCISLQSSSVPKALECVRQLTNDMPVLSETIEMSLIPQTNVNTLLSSVLKCSTEVMTKIATLCK